MRSALPWALMLATVPLVGCIGGSDDAAPEDELDAMGTGDATADEAGAAATDAGDAMDGGTTPVVEEPIEPVVVPISFDGNFETGAVGCVFVPGFLQCQGVGGGGDIADEPTGDGRVIAVDVTLTWEANSPATQELVLVAVVQCGEDCYEQEASTGTSPLLLRWMPETVEPTERLFVYASQDSCEGAVAVVVCLDLDQDFHIEGTVTWMPILEADATAASDELQPVELPDPIEAPVSFDGAFATQVWGCAGVPPIGQCIGTPPVGGGAVQTAIEPNGVLVSATLTMTWEPSSPIMEELGFWIGFECGDDCSDSESAGGTSPLTLEWQPSDPQLATDVLLSAGYSCTGIIVGFACALTEQPFHVEGTITWQPAPSQ